MQAFYDDTFHLEPSTQQHFFSEEYNKINVTIMGHLNVILKVYICSTYTFSIFHLYSSYIGPVQKEQQPLQTGLLRPRRNPILCEF